jgi:hypothetical protein
VDWHDPGLHDLPGPAVKQFHGGSATVGLLYAGPGAGALPGAATSGWSNRVWGDAASIVSGASVSPE